MIDLSAPDGELSHDTLGLAVGDERLGARIPEAWPVLLSKTQLAAYLGISSATIARICPVPPLLMSARVLRWRRTDVDLWIGGLPARPRLTNQSNDAPVPLHKIAGEDRRSAAIDRVRDRGARSEKRRCTRSRHA